MAFGHATRTTFNLGLWPRYANNLQLPTPCSLFPVPYSLYSI
ncbi:hypothetical protein [Moorena sp. SIO4G3]|nr:hypothetical protein [Moorena sp. SIO4G3]